MPFSTDWQLSSTARRWVVVAWFFLLAFVQLFILPKGDTEGPWFLYGTDSVSHDIPVQVKIWSDVQETGELPLWMPELQGGLPTLGAFLWTPASPSNPAFGLLPFPLAQKLQFLWALMLAGIGGYYLGRVQNLRIFPALLLGTGLCLSGHLVTLIHAGHLQKILALAWLPWFFAGLIGACFHEGQRAQLRNASIASVSLGMAFLNGHPQVAYMMLMATPLLLLVRFLAGRKEPSPSLAQPALLMAAVIGLGFCFGALQLLPGLEMKAQSNRGAGVKFAEAVETSYPQGELLEFFFPRFKGDSSTVGFNEYVGEWGERLVSDYAGITIGLFFIIGLFSAFKRPLSQFWLLIFLLSILIGLGDGTPVYGVLYNVLPGFASFRSPGTFFALAALAIPALAAVGFHLLQERFHPKIPTYLRTFGMLFCIGMFIYMFSYTEQTRWERYLSGKQTHADWENFLWFSSLCRSSMFIMLSSLVPLIAYAIGGKYGGTHTIMGSLMVLCLALDLSTANSAFLRREPWLRYAAYLAPNEQDALLMTEEKPLRISGYDQPLSMRPIVQGRDAVQGYHPISYGFYLDQLRSTPPDTLEGMKALGISYAFTNSQTPPVPGADLRGILPNATLWRLPAEFHAVQLLDESGNPMPMSWTFDSRSANKMVLNLDSPAAGTVVLKENAAPGWQYRWGDSARWSNLNQTGITRTIAKPEGELLLQLRYLPRSVQWGLLATLASGIVLLILLLATLLPFCRRMINNPKIARINHDSRT